MTVLAIIGAIYLLFKLAQESIENSQMREEARRRGDVTYASNRGGSRFVSNDHMAMLEFDPKTGKPFYKDLGK